MALFPASSIEGYTLGTSISILDKTSSSNTYTCLTDGYLRVVCAAGATNTPQISINGMGSDFITGTDTIRHPLVYLKRGTSLYIAKNVSSLSAADFIPLM